MSHGQESPDLKHLETIGRLSESVAHDINNLLSGVLGYSELLLEETPADHLKPLIDEILKAGKRIASLTQLLLVFRKSDYKPEYLDLNEPITQLQKFIPQIIGTRTNCTISLQPGLWSVEADPVHVIRMILLIASAVRETMIDPGQFSLETTNSPEPQNSAGSAILSAGRYVRLAAAASARNNADRPESEEEVGGNPDLEEIVRLCGGQLLCRRRPGTEFSIQIHFPAARGPQR